MRVIVGALHARKSSDLELLYHSHWRLVGDGPGSGTADGRRPCSPAATIEGRYLPPPPQDFHGDIQTNAKVVQARLASTGSGCQYAIKIRAFTGETNEAFQEHPIGCRRAVVFDRRGRLWSFRPSVGRFHRRSSASDKSRVTQMGSFAGPKARFKAIEAYLE
jgi:hypothetical protein